MALPIAVSQLSLQAIFEIMLGPLLRFDESTALKDGFLNLGLLAPLGIEPRRLHVSLRAFSTRTKRPLRFSLDKKQCVWAEKNGSFVGTCSIALPDVPIAQAFVSYDGEFCNRWIVHDRSRSSNPRFQLHRLVDDGDRFAKSFFDSKSAFEHRIALLLTLLNLTALAYGGVPEIQDAVDILAQASNGDLYVIECTTGDIDQKGKIQRLCDRARLIRTRAGQSPIPIADIYSVIFTSLPRSDIAPHLSKLEALNIAVFCREEIEQMIVRIEAPPRPEEIRATVQSFIPKSTPLGP